MTILRLSSKANAIRAYLRILIRLLNSHWLIGFRALTALKIVRFHPNSVCKYTRTIVRLSSKANAIRAYVRILIRLLNSHWLIGFRALTALKIV